MTGENPILIGYGKPRIDVVGGSSYILPWLNEEGLNEFNIPDYNTETLWKNKRIVRFSNGIRKRFVLDYKRFIPGDDCLNIQSFLEQEMEGAQLRLYPRAMNLNYNFDVFCSNAEIVLRIMRGASRAKGMKFLVLEFTTNETVRKFGWNGITNINDLQENFI